tara:strand:+ start:709 stop:1101 length:393 start_codon:yes stop_codon:yes gene_type:complete
VPKYTDFKDIGVALKKHPITNDLVTVKNDVDIKQSVKNLILTNKGERFFQPELGSDLMTLLFEPMDFGTIGLIEDEIRRVLTVYEPRIEVQELRTNPNFEDNGYEVELTFKIVGRRDTVYDIEFFLERTR